MTWNSSKTLFLTSLASGNRVSELAALRADTVRFTEEGVFLAVHPGFLYKNQREGRTPPNIFLPSLPSDRALCPVRWLSRYMQRFHKVSGPLFTNTRSGAPLSAATIASILCRTIDRADPGTLPRSHDIRRKAALLAWVRGVPPLEICRRGFCLPLRHLSSVIRIPRSLTPPGLLWAHFRPDSPLLWIFDLL